MTTISFPVGTAGGRTAQPDGTPRSAKPAWPRQCRRGHWGREQ